MYTLSIFRSGHCDVALVKSWDNRSSTSIIGDIYDRNVILVIIYIILCLDSINDVDNGNGKEPKFIALCKRAILYLLRNYVANLVYPIFHSFCNILHP